VIDFSASKIMMQASSFEIKRKFSVLECISDVNENLRTSLQKTGVRAAIFALVSDSQHFQYSLFCAICIQRIPSATQTAETRPWRAFLPPRSSHQKDSNLTMQESHPSASHEGTWDWTCSSTHILNLGIWRRWAVGFMRRLLCLRGFCTEENSLADAGNPQSRTSYPIHCTHCIIIVHELRVKPLLFISFRS